MRTDARPRQAAGRQTFAVGWPAPLFLAVAGGLLTETAFPGKSWWAMAYVGIALLSLSLDGLSIRRGFVVGGLFGLAFFLPHLWWAEVAVGGPIGWLALALLQSSAVALLGAAAAAARRLPAVRRHALFEVLVFAVLWVAVEQLRSRVPFGGFPWGLLAFSQNDSPLLGLAPLGGAPLVSAATVAAGASLAVAVRKARGASLRTAVVPLAAAIAVATVPGALPLAGSSESGVLRVAAVQGNVPTRGADAMAQARAVAANHIDGTRAALQRSSAVALDLVVWPESASDIDPRTDDALGAQISAVAREAGVPILLGTQRFVRDVRYNDYVVWTPDEGAVDVYTKQRPVPFGEYVPFRELLRRVAPAIDRIAVDMAAGTSVALVEVPIASLGRSVPIATAICFEVADDELIREAVRAGGELLVIPTNNASFGYTQESTQQLAMSRFRAAEHARATIQVSTVGVSAIITPDGQVLDETGLFSSDQMLEEVPLRTSLTLADRLGPWPSRAVDALAALIVVCAAVRSLQGRSRWLIRTLARQG